MIPLLEDRSTQPIAALRGIQKAAAIMLTLSEEEGARVLEHMEDEEIRALSAAMADMGTVSSAAMQEVIGDFDKSVALYSSVSGSLDKTEALLSKALPSEQVRVIMDELRQPSRGVWKKLSGIDRTLLAAYLKGEHPQTVALILSQVDSELSARMIASFPQPLALEVINRMLKLQPVQKEILNQLEENLQADLLANFSVKKRMDTHAAMAEVFNSFERSTEIRLMGALEELNPTSSQRIRQLMFTIEDLGKLEAAGIQTLIRGADKTMLAKALRGAPEVISSVFLANMSTRAAKTLTDDMESMQDMPPKELEAAQSELIRLAKSLIDSGEIAKPRKNGDGGSEFD